jgi:hypothetical protein
MARKNAFNVTTVCSIGLKSGLRGDRLESRAVLRTE